MSELLIGCGNSRRKKLTLDSFDWNGLVTMDHDPLCGADIEHDLEVTPWPIDDDSLDAVHAYCVIEHLGRQGDYRSFFDLFGEIFRVLKPGGHFFAICPSLTSRWAWGDPSHTRIIQPESLVFLDQSEYDRQVGVTAMTDFRWLWRGDLRVVTQKDDGNNFCFVLRAEK